jgi:hypothetical protein
MLVIAPPKLAGERLRQLFRHHLQTRRQRMPGPKDSREEIQRLGKLAGDLPLPLEAPAGDKKRPPSQAASNSLTSADDYLL